MRHPAWSDFTFRPSSGTLTWIWNQKLSSGLMLVSFTWVWRLHPHRFRFRATLQSVTKCDADFSKNLYVNVALIVVNFPGHAFDALLLSPCREQNCVAVSWHTSIFSLASSLWLREFEMSEIVPISSCDMVALSQRESGISSSLVSDLEILPFEMKLFTLWLCNSLSSMPAVPSSRE